MPRKAPITCDNAIDMFMHCRQCINELPGGESPESWARLSVGWTPVGLQVWCVRHNINVVHIDFEGAQHPATLHANQFPSVSRRTQ